MVYLHVTVTRKLKKELDAQHNTASFFTLVFCMLQCDLSTAAFTYFTVVVVESMSTTDVWRGTTYC